MGKIKIISSILVLLTVSLSYGQTQTKNKEHCKVIQKSKSVQHLYAVFEISTMNSINQTDLRKFLYQANNFIYDVQFDENNTIKIFHIDVVKVIFLKSLLVQYDCYINFKGNVII